MTTELHLIASTSSDGDRHVNPDATPRPLGSYATSSEARSAGRAYLRQHPSAWVQTQTGDQIEDVTVD